MSDLIEGIITLFSAVFELCVVLIRVVWLIALPTIGILWLFGWLK